MGTVHHLHRGGVVPIRPGCIASINPCASTDERGNRIVTGPVTDKSIADLDDWLARSTPPVEVKPERLPWYVCLRFMGATSVALWAVILTVGYFVWEYLR